MALVYFFHLPFVHLSLRTAARRLHSKRLAFTVANYSLLFLSIANRQHFFSVFHVDLSWPSLYCLTRDISSRSSLCWLLSCLLQQVLLLLSLISESSPSRSQTALKKPHQHLWTSHHNIKSEMDHAQYPVIIGAATTFLGTSAVPQNPSARCLLQTLPPCVARRIPRVNARS
jgi:hypothetical protein